MATTLNIARAGLQCFANLCLLVGICLTLSAMFTARWQIADFGDGEVYEHGLYRDCSREKGNIKKVGEWLCFWKFDEQNEKSSDQSLRLQNFQVACLILFGISCGLAILGIICAYVTCCVKYCSIPWAIASFLAAITSLVGLIVFIRNAADSSNRFYQRGNNKAEQSYGTSFDLAVSGFVLYIIATIVAGGCIALVFIEARQNRGVRTTTTTHHGTVLLGSSTKV